MPIYYVDSAAGSNTAPYDTWAKAATSLLTITALDVAGDTIYIASTHSETSAVNITLAFAGTEVSPVYLICADKTSGEPPTTVATGATIQTSTVKTILIQGCVYLYGVTFISNSDIFIGDANNSIWFDSCSLQIDDASRSTPSIGNYSNSVTAITFRNCTFKFANAGQGFTGYSSSYGTTYYFYGGSILSGSAAITKFLETSIRQGSNAFIDGFDFSNAAASMEIHAQSTHQDFIMVRDCKMPASWSGGMHEYNAAQGQRFELNNSDSSATNYRLWIEDYSGETTSETTLVRTGGANDETTGLSWKCVTSANASWVNPLTTSELVIWNSVVGSSVTATIEILHDSVTNLKDSEVWLEVTYLGTAGAPLSTFISDRAATFLTTAADQTASSETWTTTGMTNPNKQKLAVTFTPQIRGFIHARVCVAKASTTLYVDPKITVA